MEHPLRVDEFSPAEAASSVPVTLAAEAVPAAAPTTALPPLPNLSATDALLLKPSDAHYADYLAAANIRTRLDPALRAVCKTEHAVAVMVDWVHSNNLNFAVRCGGHSYEGLSQSADVVIDVRGLDTITVDKSAGLVTAGSGVSLYQIYQALAAQGLALQAGSCPTVGISGHVMGGGHGLLARSHGLTCDSLQQINVVDSQAQVLQVDAASEPDLFWACRGGGGGSFGIATRFTSIMKVGPAGGGLISMRCIGQSIGSESALRSQLKTLTTLQTPSSALSVQSLGFLDAVKHFAGPLGYEQVYMKAKSDYVLSPLGSAGIDAMMAAVAPVAAGGIVLLCDSCGGKISDVAADATAFPRRAGTQYCIQYYSSWTRAADTPAHLAQVAKVYAAMRAYMPGASYVNYCDLDLADYATAYWGDNLARLVAVKQHYDPDNLFHHAQSVPVSLPMV